ncbi:MAG TPA: GNAT family N-acetyltransferase [Pyrinomonadaceae bacterium]|nr:GNAT family N-acetyltransferase [Pyrinomonadaceae bacterium]
MAIRAATVDEAEELTAIAMAAKRHWGYPENWIKQWEADLTITSDFVSDNTVFVAEEDGEARGFYALCVNDGKAELEHMWVKPQYIVTGVGKELFLHAMDLATTLKLSELSITADPNAASFYEHMGAERVGEVGSSIEGRKLPRLKIERE